jgi:hypothetical protein
MIRIRLDITTDAHIAALPNAKHIDAVLADARKRPGAWDAARDAAQRAARDAAWGAAQRAARDAAWGAIAALVTWDSSADLLDCTPDVLRTMIDLAEPPVCHQAVLLLPYAIVRMHA